MYEFKLPDLGEGIHEAEILKWHVSPGDAIGKDAPLVDVETDKAAVTLPCPVAGKIVSLAGGVGEVLHVGQVVAVIDDGAGASEVAPASGTPGPQVGPPTRAAALTPAAGVAPTPAAAVAPAPATAAPSGGPVAAAPATRRLARELGVDLRGVEATGPGGRVTSEDVQRASAGALAGSAEAPSAPVRREGSAVAGSGPAPSSAAETSATSPGTTGSSRPAGGLVAGIPLLEVEPLPDFSAFGPVDKEPLRSIRRKVARKMTQASLLVAQVSHTDEADVTELDALRRRERERRAGQPGSRLTLMAFVMKAVVAGLKQYRMFNASLDALGEEIVYKRYYNLGVAVDSPKGLVVPVIHEADRRSVLDLALALEDLATRAREDRLDAADFRGGTFTLSNIGNLGGFSPNPIVNYPEVALLGLGRAEPKPVVEGGEIVIQTRLPLVLSFDHRIADGGEAARFMNDLRRRLGDPAALLVET